MTAHALKTGSSTRPLTVGEHELNALWLAHQATTMSEIIAKILAADHDPGSDEAVDMAGVMEVMNATPPMSEKDWRDMRGAWACLPEWQRECWRAIARMFATMVFQMLGDRLNLIPEGPTT